VGAADGRPVARSSAGVRPPGYRHRAWTLLAAHVRTNHVHVVITATAPPARVQGDLKAWSTRRSSRRGIERLERDCGPAAGAFATCGPRRPLPRHASTRARAGRAGAGARAEPRPRARPRPRGRTCGSGRGWTPAGGTGALLPRGASGMRGPGGSTCASYTPC
jgi:hypothetical protein